MMKHFPSYNPRINGLLSSYLGWLQIRLLPSVVKTTCLKFEGYDLGHSQCVCHWATWSFPIEPKP